MWRKFLEVNATDSNFVVPQKIAHLFLEGGGRVVFFFFLKTTHYTVWACLELDTTLLTSI